MDSPCRLPALRQAASCSTSRWLPQWQCACSNGHLFLSSLELRLCSHKGRGVLVDINTEEQCLSQGKVNIPIRRQSQQRPFLSVLGKGAANRELLIQKRQMISGSQAVPSVCKGFAHPSAQVAVGGGRGNSKEEHLRALPSDAQERA